MRTEKGQVELRLYLYMSRVKTSLIFAVSFSRAQQCVFFPLYYRRIYFSDAHLRAAKIQPIESRTRAEMILESLFAAWSLDEIS